VAFGQQLDPAVLQLAFANSSACDLFLAIGTSLAVQPAASLAAQAKRASARLVIVNQGETSLDDLAGAKLRGPIGEVLPRLVSATTWDR
jgi:NAD-dependent deacetylase